MIIILIVVDHFTVQTATILIFTEETDVIQGTVNWKT